MNHIVFAVILMVPLSFLVLLLQRKRRIKSIAEQLGSCLPSPPRLPLIGNLHQLGSTPHRSLYKLSKKHGPLMLLHLGTVRTLVVSSAKIAEEVIRNNDAVFSNRPTSKLMDVLSFNKNDIAFAQYGEGWRQMRRLGTTHLLSSKRVRSLSFDRIEEVSLLLQKVADAASSGDAAVICLTDMLNDYVTNVITRVVLGSRDAEEKKVLLSELSHKSSTLFYQIVVGDFFPAFKWLDALWGLDTELKDHGKNWDALLEDVINYHSKQYSSKEAEGKKSTSCFIQMLLQLQKDSNQLGFLLTRDNIKAVTLDMITAGIDTTKTALDWCMTELIRNSEAMKKVKDEVRKTGNEKEMITEEQLDQMSYLKVFIKEVFRLHPPSPLLIPRESLHECQIQGYTIPKQTRLIINAWAFGRDESYWKEAEKFMPERFIDNPVLDYRGKDFNFIPFGVGRRICPGIDFSLVLIELALVNLLHRFDWNLPSGISIEDMDMDDSGGIIAPRKHKLELVPTACNFN